LFFKWIKQHLRINAIYRTSISAVKTQVWSAISVYHRSPNSSWGHVGDLLSLSDKCHYLMNVK
jgi:hypothetical protein